MLCKHEVAGSIPAGSTTRPREVDDPTAQDVFGRPAPSDREIATIEN